MQESNLQHPIASAEEEKKGTLEMNTYLQMYEMHPIQAYRYETSPVKSSSTSSSHTYYVSHSALPEVHEHVSDISII